MQFIGILIDVVGPVFLVAAVGFGWARRNQPFDTRFVALVVTGVGTPCLILDSLAATRSGIGALGTMAFASALCLGLSLTLGYGFVRLMRQPVAVYLPSLTFSNAGNIGLPMTLFAFGDAGFAYSIAYFTMASLGQFTVGQAIAARGMKIRDLLKVPLVWAVLAAIFLAVTGLRMPPVAARAIHMLAGLAVPLMLLSLGFSLANLRISSLGRGAAFAAARLLGGFAIGWAVSLAFGFQGVERGVLVAQSSMPCAVYNYMFAARYNNKPEEVAGLVVLSTLMSIMLLPLFLASVM